MIHELKTWPEPFEGVWSGEKTHEIRRDDRPFAAGDGLRLVEWSPIDGYTGRWIDADVTCVTRDGAWGLPPGLCVMSIRISDRHCTGCGAIIVQPKRCSECEEASDV